MRLIKSESQNKHKIDNLSPSGVPISLRRLRRNPFAVFQYGFMNHDLDSQSFQYRSFNTRVGWRVRTLNYLDCKTGEAIFRLTRNAKLIILTAELDYCRSSEAR